MITLKVSGLRQFRAFVFLSALLVCSYMPAVYAQTNCWMCTNPQQPGAEGFCQQTGQGVLNCASSNGRCVAWGPTCWFTLADDSDPTVRKCATENPKFSLIQANNRLANNRLANSPERIAVRLNADELRKLEEMKSEVVKDAAKGLMPDTPVDYIKLFQVERRDEAWASRVEDYLDSQLAMMQLGNKGLSKPIVKCASSACEISVVQNADYAQEVINNWQLQFLGVVDTKSNFLGIVDRAIFMTPISKQKIGFVSYLLFDR